MKLTAEKQMQILRVLCNETVVAEIAAEFAYQMCKLTHMVDIFKFRNKIHIINVTNFSEKSVNFYFYT